MTIFDAGASGIGGNIDRNYIAHSSVHVDTVLADADEINYSKYAHGKVYVPVGSALTLLTFHTANTTGGTYLADYDDFNAATTLVVSAGTSRKLPDALSGAGAFKMVGNADGTVDLTLKG